MAARSRQIARPSSTSSSMPWARSHRPGVDVASRRRELVDGDLAGDVLLAEPLERLAATLVAAIGPHPLGPRAPGQLAGGRRVVEGDDPAARARERDGVAHPAGARRCALGMRAPSGASGPGDSVPGTTTTVDSASALEADAHLGPPALGPLAAARTGRLSSSSLASTTHGPGTRGRSARLTTIGPGRRRRRRLVLVVGVGRAREGERGRVELEVLGVERPLVRRHLDEHVAQRRGAPGAAARTDRASVPGPGAGLDHGEHVGLARVAPPARRARARRPRRRAGPPPGW